MSIEVRNITKVFGEQKALDNVSFEIRNGEIVGFLGPNGAGKSTLMKIITGYIPATNGEVLINGMNILENPIEIRKKLGYLPEQNPLYFDMYIVEYLKFVAGIYGIKNKKARIDEIVSLTGLEPEINKKIGTLSKGYKQRVGLAQAIIHDPEVLILDEPTSGLDPNQIIEIRNLIKNLGKEKTVILSTHIMQEVEAICDRILLIKKGVLLANDKAEDFAHLNSDSISTLLVEFDGELAENDFAQIKGIRNVRKQSPTRFAIEYNKNNDIRKSVFNLAVQKGLAVLNMQEKEKSIEEVFAELTNG
ncbi:MAG: gliding motility-associated ABC transporter ATP-binding subunit GldA [Bacteroidales bacterium]|jgi:ABC-2 type transport system ATP-binding protein|nr:gliding motility-associated ABC transporter ATP-binding subunit GldA [Bacteroidales bacterium]